MFLRSLTVRGFKSFADRTTLEFTPGISVIVGPNGSGKSNLVDAISWVLGEQGPRALRGGQMADVIFAGSASRAGLGLAEVKLVIDNSAGIVPVPLTEIEVSRAVFRSGDSEYRIGGQAVRLLDIQELLAETGIGRALHTVVGQGQLEDVLTARPEERRQYIEEAAGIAKHRRRKERAQRKLAGLEQDLLRLQDVMAELRRQLRPLKQQAEMAARHERLSSEAEELAWRLAASRLRDLYAGRDAKMSGWEEGLRLRTEARDRLAALDAELARLAQARGGTETALAEAEDRHRAAAEFRSQAERALRRAVDRVADARSRLAQSAAHAARLAALDQDRSRAEAGLRATVEALEEREGALARAEEAFRAADLARRDAEDERRRVAERAAAHRAESEAMHRSLRSSEHERERLLATLAQVTERVAAVEAGRAELESRIEDLDAEETPLARRHSALERERHALAAEVAEGDEEVRALVQRRAVIEARRRDLEETPGSRFLASRAGAAAGLLRDMVTAEPGMEAALASALGSLRDAVVYERRDDALADAPGGDGAVLAVPGAETYVLPPALPGERPLLDAVRADPKAYPLLARLLRDVYLVDDLAAAEAGHRASPRCSFVTTQGVLVGPSVIRTAAQADARARALRSELQAVDHELATAHAALGPKAARLEGLQAELRDVAGQLEQADQRITAAADGLGALAPQLSSLEKERELLEERLGGLDDAAASWRETLASAAPAGVGEPPPLPPAPEAPIGLRVDVETLRRDRHRLEETLARLAGEREALAAGDPHLLQQELEDADGDRVGAEDALRNAEASLEEAEARRSEAVAADRAAADAEGGANRAWREAAGKLDRLREEYEVQDRTRADLERRITEAERLLKEGHERQPVDAVATLGEDDTPEALERRADLVARRLGLLGRVNLLAQGEFQALQERHDFLAREIDDVRAARRDLNEVIGQIDERIAELFGTAYRDVATEFERLFGELFPGGQGRVVLTNPDQPLESGIELEAQPGRKRVKRLSLLSGGERALTALAFLFAIFRARPSPFYLLDEVEAALDDVNLQRFIGLIRDFAATSQVLVVTHQKRTMEAADALYGVSMKDGATRVICQRFEGVDVVTPRATERVPAPEPAPHRAG
ncbi:MAG: chromosome segregation SMC family protein [Actinomycetota bacterium]